MVGLLLMALFSLAASEGYHANVGIPLAAKIKALEEVYLEDTVGLTSRIGGSDDVAGAFPFVVGIHIQLVEGLQSICSGSLLTPNRVVTAALCWFDGQYQAVEFQVVLGNILKAYVSPMYIGNAILGDGLLVRASQVVTHPRWLFNLSDRINIAMVYLSIPVIYNSHIQPIALPYSYVGETFAGNIATLAGYGIQIDNLNHMEDLLVLKRVSQVNLLVLSNEICRQVNEEEGKIIKDNDWVFDTTICSSGVGGVGMCIGDTGGPLFVIKDRKPVLIGIASIFPEFNCSSGLPSGYTRVTSVLDFINNHL